MKTEMNKEERWSGKNSKDGTINVPLESGETLLYKEHSALLKASRLGTALILFLFFAFPFYSMVLGAGLGILCAGVTTSEFMETLANQSVGMVLMFAFCFLTSGNINNFFKRFFPSSNYLVITDRRIFYTCI